MISMLASITAPLASDRFRDGARVVESQVRTVLASLSQTAYAVKYDVKRALVRTKWPDACFRIFVASLGDC